MAHASGLASENPITGSFFHKESGVTYRVYQDAGKLWLAFDRDKAPALHGKREFLYYIGSGQLKGRTYLFNVDGFLFESPVNWYAQQRLWDMTPNYQNTREAPLDLPAFPECLNCHSSDMQPPILGTVNRYPDPPFAHGGVTCERCHGPGLDHATPGAKMLRLDLLPPARRDAICMQCHLEANVAVERPHRHAYEFRPGDDLFDFVRYYVLTSKRGTRGVSQFEALAQSACKRASGDKMTCITCHDPHSTPDAATKVEYYRAKCLACHGEAFAAKHHPENRDCVTCHMPAASTTDITHTQVTDHRILRRPGAATLSSATLQTSELEPFPNTPETSGDVRDLALAYETLAERGDEAAAGEAQHLLPAANKANPNDAPVQAALAYLSQKHGDTAKARELYESALHEDPNLPDAATNLGILEAKEGHLRAAVSLWENVFENQPWRSKVGLDIALGYCAAGRFDHATEYVNRVLEFNPDFSLARSLQEQLKMTPPQCSVR
ncbi:MAG TPA: cytochrome c3 family protein [Terriglobales bacterium]|nr:cytochrome c3 family protein [Terriglobales bacterium]